MIYLLLSIVSSGLIFIVFKWMGKLQMNTFLVIVLNYFFAGLCGILISPLDFFSTALQSEWAPYAIILGSVFVGMFYVMATATHRSGASAAVVANKMSVVIPITVAFLFLGDEPTLLKNLGIFLALIGIFFASSKEGLEKRIGKSFFLILLLFVGSGLIDTSIKLIQNAYLSDSDVVGFTTVLFSMAFLSGIIVLLFNFKKHVSTFKMSKLYMALFLGLVNFGSIYFLINALMTKGMESSVLFPLNNIGVVVFSTIGSVLLFGEKLSRKNVLGVILSILALVVLMLST